MAITVKHAKTSTIPDGADTDLVRPSDWNADHTLTGLGTMAEQNANNVAITGGSVSGVTLSNDTISGGIGSPDYIAFNTSYVTALTAGQLGWDGNNTLGLGMAGGNVTQHIGEDQFFYCKASSAITKGQVVMFTGAVGASGVPTGAPATGITDGTYIMGVAAEAIALNGFGLVQSFGTLRNVNTSGFADGDILWYDPAVTGGLTKTKPSAPNVKVQMAAVINGGSSGGGTILIRIDPGSTLGGTDSNAQITSPTGGQTLTYDQTDGYWKNTSLTAGTAITITPDSNGAISISSSAVTSVTGTSPISSSGGTTPTISLGTVPAANGGTGLTSPGTAGNVLTSNGTAWVSSAPSSGITQAKSIALSMTFGF